jgi:hypothetical protein
MINPWLIYLMSCANGLLIIACIIAFISFVCVFLGVDEENPTLLKQSAILLAVSVMLIIIIPSEKTCLAIIASQTITPDNLPTDMYSYIKDLYETCGRVVNNR